jgi:transposase InsO family protein
LEGLTDRNRRPYRQGCQLPAISTVHAVLDRHGLVNRPRRRRYKAEGTELSRPLQPNELWCTDYKGEFMLADRRYCYPLTVTDAASRCLIITMRTHSGNGFRNQPQVIMTCFVARTRVNKIQITHYGKSEFSWPFSCGVGTVCRA